MAAHRTALVSVCPGSTLPWSVVGAFLQQEGLEASSLSFASSSTSHTSSGYAAALCSAASDAQHNREAFGAIARSLVPGGRLYVYDSLRDATRQAGITKDLLLSGFSGSKVDAYSDVVLVQATKPSWDVGVKSSLRKPAAAAPAAVAAVAASAANTWAISGAEDEDELMDDEELLTEEDKKPVTMTADDCEVGKAGKKACKNCSCGRAEMEEQQGVKLTTEMLENPVSACGSCGLGDAFRCASCPYRGLPAFEAGKKITLGADLLTADV